MKEVLTRIAESQEYANEIHEEFLKIKRQELEDSKERDELCRLNAKLSNENLASSRLNRITKMMVDFGLSREKIIGMGYTAYDFWKEQASKLGPVEDIGSVTVAGLYETALKQLADDLEHVISSDNAARAIDRIQNLLRLAKQHEKNED